MTTYVYVAAQDDDKVSIFTMDESSGALALQSEVAIEGGPSLLALSQDKSALYVGHRSSAQISSHRIDRATGGFSQTGVVETRRTPPHTSSRTGRASTCFVPSTRAPGLRCFPWATTAASGVRPPRRWLRTMGRTRS